MLTHINIHNLATNVACRLQACSSDQKITVDTALKVFSTVIMVRGGPPLLLSHLKKCGGVPFDDQLCQRVCKELEKRGIPFPAELQHSATWPLPKNFLLTPSERLGIWRSAFTRARAGINPSVFESFADVEPYFVPAGDGNVTVCAHSPVPSIVCKAVFAPKLVNEDLSNTVPCQQYDLRVPGSVAFYEGLRALRDQDYALAVLHFKAAGPDHAQASFNLGWMAEDGLGCERNMQAAVGYYEHAAELGYHVAHQNLGSIFCVDSDSVACDMPRAIAHFEVGIALDLPESMGSLGRILWHSTGVEHDPERAQRLLTRAATFGDRRSLNTLATILETQTKQGDGVPPQIVFEMYYEAASGFAMPDDVTPFYNLARCYRNGYGTAQDMRKARRVCRLAALGGDPDAQADLAWMYICGDAGQINYRTARVWAEKAAAQNNARGRTLVATLEEA